MAVQLTVNKRKLFRMDTKQQNLGLPAGDYSFRLLREDGTAKILSKNMEEFLLDAGVLVNGGVSIGLDEATITEEQDLFTSEGATDFEEIKTGDVLKFVIDDVEDPVFYVVKAKTENTVTLDKKVDFSSATKVELKHVPNTGIYNGVIEEAENTELGTFALIVECESKGTYDTVAQIEVVSKDVESVSDQITTMSDKIDQIANSQGIEVLGEILI